MGGKYIELILLQPEDRSIGCSLAAAHLSTIKPLPSQVAREACTYRTPALFGILQKKRKPKLSKVSVGRPDTFPKFLLYEPAEA